MIYILLEIIKNEGDNTKKMFCTVYDIDILVLEVKQLKVYSDYLSY